MATDNKNTANPLDSFLKEFHQLTIRITEESHKRADDEDEKAVIKAFSPTLIDQVNGLNGYIREQVRKGSKQQIAETDRVLSLTSGVSLAKNASGVLPSVGSVLGKLGLSRIVKELKKIFRAIMDVLGVVLPPWFDALLNLIDEILDGILSAGSAKMATTLSIQEQNYLSELTHLSKLQHANRLRFSDDDDDE